MMAHKEIRESYPVGDLHLTASISVGLRNSSCARKGEVIKSETEQKDNFLHFTWVSPHFRSGVMSELRWSSKSQIWDTYLPLIVGEMVSLTLFHEKMDCLPSSQISIF